MMVAETVVEEYSLTTLIIKQRPAKEVEVVKDFLAGRSGLTGNSRQLLAMSNEDLRPMAVITHFDSVNELKQPGLEIIPEAGNGLSTLKITGLMPEQADVIEAAIWGQCAVTCRRFPEGDILNRGIVFQYAL